MGGDTAISEPPYGALCSFGCGAEWASVNCVWVDVETRTAIAKSRGAMFLAQCLRALHDLGLTGVCGCLGHE